MPDQLQLRGGTTAQHTSFTGASKEVTVDTTKKTAVVHDGSTVGGVPLLREDGSNSALTLGSAGTPSIKFTGDPDTGIYSPGANQLAVATNGTGRLFINSTGLVGIGTSSPQAKLQCQDSISAQTGTVTLFQNTYDNITANGTTAYPVIRLQRLGVSGTTYPSQADLAVARYENVSVNARTRLDFRLAHVGSSGAPDTTVMSLLSSGRVGIGTASPGSALEINAAAATAPFIAKINTSEAARIDSSGRFLVGTSTARANMFNATLSSAFQVEGTTHNTSSVSIVRNSNDASAAAFVLGKSRGAAVGSSTLVNNNDTIAYLSFQGADGSQLVECASIAAYVDGTPGANDMPGRLVFSTTADGASSPTEACRIDSSQRLVVGATSAQSSRLLVKGENTASSEYVCRLLDSSDLVLFFVRNDGYIQTGTGASSPYNLTTASAANVWVGANGELRRSTSSAKYKTDIIAAEHGLAELLQLRPVTYKGINDGDKAFGGLIAEEVHDAGLTEFVQYAEDGTPDALAYGNMVSLCIKAIQEQQVVISELQAKVAALESA